MSSIATPAPAAPPSLGSLVEQALGGAQPTDGGQLQTAAPVEAAPPLAPPPVNEEAPPPGEPEPGAAEAVATEPVEPFSLGLDGDDLAIPPEAAAEPQPAQPKPPSVTEELLEDLASSMTRPEAEKMMSGLLRLPKGREMLANLKSMRAVEQQIGYAPTPDEIVSFQQSHTQLSRFWDDFSSTDPQRQAAVVDGLFGLGPNGEMVQGSSEFLDALPSTLKRVSPQMYGRLAAPVARDMAAMFRQMATEYTSPDDQARWVDAANLIDLASGVKPPGTAEESPEIVQLRDQLERERSRGQEQAQTALQQSVKQATGAYFGELQKAMMADVTKALEPLRGKVDDVTFRAYHRDLFGEVAKFAQGYRTNEAVKSRINRTLQEAASRRDPAPIRAEVLRARKVYEVKLGELRIPYLKAGSSAAATAARATADKLQQSQHKTETTQPVTAAASGVSVGLPARRDGESGQDYLKRSMDALFQ